MRDIVTTVRYRNLENNPPLSDEELWKKLTEFFDAAKEEMFIKIKETN
jgi:hypothetical protein